MSKPFSEACENNKAPILAIISKYFKPGKKILEIGSYTTQHVQYFAEKMPEVYWQPSDISENVPIMLAGLEDAQRDNIRQPVSLDVCDERWSVTNADGIFSANTLHIMPESRMPRFFHGAGAILAPHGYLCVYGPFKYGGDFTSESNARFDSWLKIQDADSGIRDFEQADALASNAGLALIADHAMPANNQLLVWQKMLNYFPV